MKKALLVSFFLHCFLVVLIIAGSIKEKKEFKDVYVVDLLSTPLNMDVSENVMASFKTEYAEASITGTIKNSFNVVKNHSEKVNDKSFQKPEEVFSTEQYISEIREKLAMSGSPYSKDKKTSSTQKLISTDNSKKASLASRIFPLTSDDGSKAVSIGFQGSIPSSENIIPLEYLENIKIALQRNWNPPPEKNYSLTCVVSFRLKKDGTITDIYLEKSSGVNSFDRSSLEAVKITEKVESLPSTYKSDYLDISVKFNMRGLE